MTLFTKGDLLVLADQSRMERGAALIEAVDELYEDEYSLVATVHDGGSYMAMVHHGDGVLGGECDCPDGRAGTFCEHSVAVGLYYLAEDEAGRSEGFGYFGEIASLWDAVTADDLHKILVMHPTFRSVADAHEPEELFRKHHTTQPARARRPACPRAATSATMNTMVMPSDTSERLRQNVYAPSWSKRLFSDRIPGVLPDPMLTPLQRPADELVEHRDGERQLAVAGGET